MPCGREGNRRSGVAVAMRPRLQRFIHIWAHGLRKENEHPAYTPHGLWHSFFTYWSSTALYKVMLEITRLCSASYVS